MLRRRLLALGAAVLAGCVPNSDQSALYPASSAASKIAELWWVMAAGLGVVTLVVIGLMLYAVSRPRQESARPPLGDLWFVVTGGLIVPGMILGALLVYALETTAALRSPQTTLTIEVVGHMWWWAVRYPEAGIVTANEIHIPVGRPVRLELRAQDVIHSFWVPALHGKVDLLPEVTNRFWLQADRPGRFRGQCAEFCGGQHANMAFWVVALEPAAFEAWLATNREPPPPPTTPERRRGLETFMSAGCAGCHAIGGTPAAGTSGPDLSRIGSRLSLGAGTVPHQPGAIARWVADPQSAKPGNLMPPARLRPEDLSALAAYLEGLK